MLSGALTLQDVLVRLSMRTGRMTEWLPWFAASKAAEVGRALEEAEEEERRGAEQEQALAGLSPELPSCTAACAADGAARHGHEGRVAEGAERDETTRAALLF